MWYLVARGPIGYAEQLILSERYPGHLFQFCRLEVLLCYLLNNVGQVKNKRGQ